jgi:1-acyl-sn-glycerol-3-phosphate acyltransferase
MNYASPELIRAEKNLEKISNAALKNVLFVSEGATWDEALVSAENLARFVESENEAGRSNESASVVHILPSQDLAQERLEKWQRWIGEGKFNEIEKRLHNASVQLGMKTGAYAAFFNQVAQPFGTLDYGQWAELPLFNNFIHSDGETVQLVTVVKTPQEHRSQLTAGVSEMEGIAILDKQHLTNKVITFLSQDFDQLVKWSLLVVFLILLIIYGRIEIAIFTFIPMLLAWLWTLGLMQIFDLQFNIFNIIISTFIFGLGIDYSIFITRSFMQQFKFGRDELVAYKNSIFLSAFTTTVGVGVLIFAGHPALKSIAAMSLVGIISMVLMAYTVQPLLLRWAMTDRKNRGLVPVNAVNLFLGLFSLTYFFVGCLVLNLAIVLLQLVPVSGDRKRMLFRGLMSVFLGSLAAIMANVRRQYLNPHGETFAKPAVVIANHQSFIDILITLNIHPKMVMVVKKWVYDSPVFGWAVRYAGYFHVNDGYEKFIPRLRELVKQGCSIVVFPEGTRSEDGQLNRFHKGAFYLSEQLELDIVPVIFHGNAYSMPKGDSYLLKNGFIHRVIEPRILYHDRSWGNTYQERTKSISAHFKSRFADLKKEFETPDYFRDQLIRNYILKGPMLEWYTRIKTRMEGNYQFFHEHLPTEGTIVDIGCGYGYLAHILAWTSNKREVIGFDHDEEKVAVAANTPVRTPNLRFEKHNLLTDSVPPADAYVLADVLHYLPEPDQQRVIKQCIAQLNRGGVLLIRDADAELRGRQKGTWLTEFISTNLGFNKMNSNKLCFVSRAFVEKTVHDSGTSFTVFDRSRFTSNVVYLIRKPVG